MPNILNGLNHVSRKTQVATLKNPVKRLTAFVTKEHSLAKFFNKIMESIGNLRGFNLACSFKFINSLSPVAIVSRISLTAV